MQVSDRSPNSGISACGSSNEESTVPKEVKSCHSQLEGPLSAGWSVAINEDKEGTSRTHRAFAENVERKFLLLLLFSGHFEFLILVIFFPLSFVEARQL